MLDKIDTNTYLTEDGFPALPLWIDQPDLKGSRFIHWSGDDGYDVGCDRLTISVVTRIISSSHVLTLDYHDWEGETWAWTKAVFAHIGRDRLVRLREDTNALIRRDWEQLGEWRWRGRHPEEDRMLDNILPPTVHHDWKTLGF